MHARRSFYLWIPGSVSMAAAIGLFYWSWRFASLAAERGALLSKIVNRVKTNAFLTADQRELFVALIEQNQQNSHAYSDFFLYIGIVAMCIALLTFGVAITVLRERRTDDAKP